MNSVCHSAFVGPLENGGSYIIYLTCGSDGRYQSSVSPCLKPWVRYASVNRVTGFEENTFMYLNFAGQNIAYLVVLKAIHK